MKPRLLLRSLRETLPSLGRDPGVPPSAAMHHRDKVLMWRLTEGLIIARDLQNVRANERTVCML